MPERLDSRERRDPDAVYIGAKPTMTYVFQVVSHLYSGPGPVRVRARGAVIAKAVDVVEVVRRRFLEGAVTVGPIEIGTERLVNRAGRETNVSTITIPLVRAGPLPPGPAPGAAPGAAPATDGSPSAET